LLATNTADASSTFEATQTTLPSQTTALPSVTESTDDESIPQLTEEELRFLEERRAFVMEEARNFIASDLDRIFKTGELTVSRYDPNIRFEDPLVAYDNIDGYIFYIRALKALFNIDWQLHTVDVTGPDEVTARWTMGMQLWLLPWRPYVVFTGRSFYKVNTDTGKILSHVDAWDVLKHNRFLSLEGVTYVLRTMMEVQVTPDIEVHKFSVLKKVKDYELRSYPPYLVAETAMPGGAGPASGSGFMELADFIFGNNREKVKMEMTSPVITTVPPGQVTSSAMQFVMEGRFTEVNQLPSPVDSRVLRKSEKGGVYAAVRFSGWPLDYEVVQNERALRDALLRDGYNPLPGYSLARYNEPSVPPMFRRNEVLIELHNFTWP